MMNSEWTGVLLSWFDVNRREFPWREGSPRDPYHVWIAEIMLQQTRTEAVRPYFVSWLSRFPTVASLAAADEAEVLHAWQGLGYYSRARNIRRAAQVLASEYGGDMLRDVEKIRALPGIGDYTAGAIASIAFGLPVPAVDGNVLRVFSRLYALEEDVTSPAAKRQVTALVSEVLPPPRPGDFHEALMDLGADICIPKTPRCRDCPLAPFCTALKEGRETELPHRKKKMPQREFFAACALVEKDGAYLLHKREEGMLAQMWEFPMALAETERESRNALALLLDAKPGEMIWEYTHVFTHRIWHMRAFRVDGEVRVPQEGEWKWVCPADMRKIPMAGPHGKLAGILYAENLED